MWGAGLAGMTTGTMGCSVAGRTGTSRLDDYP